MKLFVVAAFIGAAVAVHGQDSGPAARPSPATLSSDEPLRAERRIVHDGQAFELASSTVGKNVETDEYVLAGEKIAKWTQLLTVQRLALAKPAAADEFLAYFRKRVGEDKATLDMLMDGRTASVFAVRFPKTEQNEEQVMICLAFVDSLNPARLNIVQYAIKPTRTPVAEVERHITSWRDKFVEQARAMAPTVPGGAATPQS